MPYSVADLLAAAAEAERLNEVDQLVRRLLGADAAAEAQREYTGRLENGGPPEEAPGLVRLSDVEPKSVRWLWPGHLPLGKLALIDGDPGLGKSALALDLAARVSRGAPMPDGSSPDLEGPRGVVLLTAEDGLRDTVRPRLDAAGADPERVAALDWVPAGEEGEGGRLPTVADLGDLHAAIRRMRAALVIVDPLTAFLGREVDAHRDTDVRSALNGLADLADAAEVTVAAIRHLNKSGGANPLYRGGGSIGFIGAARAGFLVAEAPDDPEARVLACTKQNLAPEPPSLTYRPEVSDNGRLRIAWEGESEHGARELLETPTGEERTARDEAAEFLAEELAAGPRPVGELKEAAEDLGLSWRTVQRAKRDLEIDARRQGGVGDSGRWTWELESSRARERPTDVAALGVENDEDPGAHRGDPKDDTSPDELAPLGEAETGSEPATCPGCGRPIGPTADLCGSCRREGVEA